MNTPLRRTELLMAAGLVLVGTLGCDWSRFSFRRNPDLVFVAGDSMELRSFVQPAWTPDGTQIYYLATKEWGTIWEGGTLWLVDVNGTGTHQVLADTFCALALSPDGQELALATGGDRWTGGRLAVYHVDQAKLESLPTTPRDIFRVLFSKSGPPRLYYISRSIGVFRANLDGSAEELVSPSYSAFLQSSIADSVVVPSIHPTGRFSVGVGYASVPLGAHTDDVVIVDRRTGDTTFLYANPYKYSNVGHPVWSPDGRDVAFTAAPVEGEPLRAKNGELWILHDVVPDGD